jgi:ubiquinone/menaquinone biosynthesis C-methylase UbiE
LRIGSIEPFGRTGENNDPLAKEGIMGRTQSAKVSKIETQVQQFYDEYWPSNLPTQEDLEETRRHLLKIIPTKQYDDTLDAGCGLGVCTVALSDISNRVVGLDISPGSLVSARELAGRLGKKNIEFKEASLMEIPYPDETFDLVLCWGVLMYVPSAEKVFSELVRTLKPGGALIVAVHRKSALTPVHDLIRRACLRIPKAAKGATIKSAATVIRLVSTALGRKPARNDLTFEAKVDDFYFVPFKRFFSVAEVKALFDRHHLCGEIVFEYTGRFKSTSSFIMRAKKSLRVFVAFFYPFLDVLEVVSAVLV